MWWLSIVGMAWAAPVCNEAPSAADVETFATGAIRAFASFDVEGFASLRASPILTAL